MLDYHALDPKEKMNYYFESFEDFIPYEFKYFLLRSRLSKIFIVRLASAWVDMAYLLKQRVNMTFAGVKNLSPTTDLPARVSFRHGGGPIDYDQVDIEPSAILKLNTEMIHFLESKLPFYFASLVSKDQVLNYSLYVMFKELFSYHLKALRQTCLHPNQPTVNEYYDIIKERCIYANLQIYSNDDKCQRIKKIRLLMTKESTDGSISSEISYSPDPSISGSKSETSGRSSNSASSTSTSSSSSCTTPLPLSPKFPPPFNINFVNAIGQSFEFDDIKDDSMWQWLLIFQDISLNSIQSDYIFTDIPDHLSFSSDKIALDTLLASNLGLDPISSDYYSIYSGMSLSTSTSTSTSSTSPSESKNSMLAIINLLF